MVGLQLKCESKKGVTVVSNPFSFAYRSRQLKSPAGPALWQNWFTWQKHPDGIN
jgi:hypothetical protein